jgi:hypothetical protein
MTAPSLVVLAGWDPGLVRGATGLLTSVAGRLPGWRFRLEAVGRELESAGCWTGPASAEAAAAVLALSTAAAAVSRACDTSLAGVERLTAHATSAGATAGQALALAAAAGIELDATGEPVRPVPGPADGMTPDQADALVARAAAVARAVALAQDAVRDGGIAAAAAEDADDALRPVGVVDAFAPAGFGELAALAGAGFPAFLVPPLPASRAPDAVAAWWAALDAAAQRAALAAQPDLLGALDGLPAWARDRANRTLLLRALQDPAAPGYDVAVTVAGTLAAAPGITRLLEFVARDGLVAVALGDPDTADDVAVLVPGIFTTVDDDLGAFVHDAAGVAGAAGSAGAASVATVAWLGYRTPQSLFEAAYRTDARVGGRALAGALAGMSAARAAEGLPAARTTVVAHSYGTVVTDQAADRPGRLAADAVVLMGSPGMEPDGAAGLEAPEVYDAAGWSDPVAAVRWFGEGPWEPGYGATPLPTDTGEGHGDYYDPGHPTLAALGQVVAGTFAPR